MSNIQTIDDAIKTLKDVIKNPNKKKFRFLKDYLKFLAHSFELENKKNFKNTDFKTYVHGSVVKVNFGVNVGDEFSLNHFVLVLTKDDNPRNPCLTVVPLSSQKRSGGVEIGQSLYNAITNHFIKNSRLFNLFMSYLELSAIYISQPKSLELLTKIKSILESFEEYGLQHNDVYQFIMRVMNEYIGEDKILELSFSEMNEILKYEIEKMHQERIHFRKFDKNTFAVVSKITTISKYRIEKPRSTYDPFGSISVTDYELNLMKDEILKLFI